MDPFLNPFAPGAGTAPPFLAGRDEVIRAVRLACDRAARGDPARSFLITGHRGVGKTVLLNRMAAEAEGDGHLVTQLEASAGHSLADLLRGPMARTLRRLAEVQGGRFRRSDAADLRTTSPNGSDRWARLPQRLEKPGF